MSSTKIVFTMALGEAGQGLKTVHLKKDPKAKSSLGRLIALTSSLLPVAPHPVRGDRQDDS
jgi:hypothetical protein